MEQAKKACREVAHRLDVRVVRQKGGPPDDTLMDALEHTELVELTVSHELASLTHVASGSHTDVALVVTDEVDEELELALTQAREHETLSGAIWLVATSTSGMETALASVGTSFDDVIELPADRARLDARIGTWARILSRLRTLERRNAKLYELATTDELTGLPNRRHLLNELRREIARARRHDEAMSVAMLDVDYFKRVNDDYGHAVGDAVLAALARTTSGLVRETDILGRLGGEEFVLCLPQTSEDCARIVCERLRAAIERMRVPYDEGEVHITISVGVARFDAAKDDVDRLLKRADEAMYEAKESGRNAVR